MFAILARVGTLCALVCIPILAQSPPSAPSSSSGLDLKAIDKSVNPCQDFYHYACGGWLKSNPIPAEESRRGRFDELHDRNQATLRGILEKAEAHPSSSVLDQKIGAFYGSCMNEAEIERRGPQ